MSALGSTIIETWPHESKEAAKLVIDKYGEPDEATDSLLIWFKNGPWKRTFAFKEFDRHHFPVPHIDCIQSFLDYRVPVEKLCELASFDGSVVVERTRGELSARCHDEEANLLALNLAHDIITGKKTVEDARDYYAHEFLAYRRKQPTPYMERLRFQPAELTTEADQRVLTDEQVEDAEEEGRRKG